MTRTEILDLLWKHGALVLPRSPGGVTVAVLPDDRCAPNYELAAQLRRCTRTSDHAPRMAFGEWQWCRTCGALKHADCWNVPGVLDPPTPRAADPIGRWRCECGIGGPLSLGSNAIDHRCSKIPGGLPTFEVRDAAPFEASIGPLHFRVGTSARATRTT